MNFKFFTSQLSYWFFTLSHYDFQISDVYFDFFVFNFLIQHLPVTLISLFQYMTSTTCIC